MFEASTPGDLAVLYLLIAIAVIGALLATVPFIVRRDRRLDEVERFHRARRMTTGWSMSGVTRPPLADDAARDEDAPQA